MTPAAFMSSVRPVMFGLGRSRAPIRYKATLYEGHVSAVIGRHMVGVFGRTASVAFWKFLE
jgi:hypothetical protein